MDTMKYLTEILLILAIVALLIAAALLPGCSWPAKSNDVTIRESDVYIENFNVEVKKGDDVLKAKTDATTDAQLKGSVVPTE